MHAWTGTMCDWGDHMTWETPKIARCCPHGHMTLEANDCCPAPPVWSLGMMGLAQVATCRSLQTCFINCYLFDMEFFCASHVPEVIMGSSACVCVDCVPCGAVVCPGGYCSVCPRGLCPVWHYHVTVDTDPGDHVDHKCHVAASPTSSTQLCAHGTVSTRTHGPAICHALGSVGST